MRAVITVVGKDMVGIVATVATECAATNANILDVTQSVFEDDIFAMVIDAGGCFQAEPSAALNCPTV